MTVEMESIAPNLLISNVTVRLSPDNFKKASQTGILVPATEHGYFVAS
jgi:hypothetical protein